jgi:Predicted membrane protein (DUF2142)
MRSHGSWRVCLAGALNYLGGVSIRSVGELALRIVRKWWIAPLLCSFFGLGMFVGSPTMAASDAEVHLGTAWYDIHHGFPIASRVSIPDVDSVGPCYVGAPQLSADCVTAPAAGEVNAYIGRLVNYPPPFYWVMGAGELAMSSLSTGAIGDGGRLFGLVACLSLLFLSAWRLHRVGERSALWSIYLLVSPIAVFDFAGGNPSGWEIACAILFTATLLYRRDALASGTLSLRAFVSILIAGLLLSTSRPLSALWLVAIALTFALWTGVWKIRRTKIVLLLALLPGIAANVAWNLAYPSSVYVGGQVAPASVHELLTAVAYSAQDVLGKAATAWGVLGWEDTHPSAFALFGLLAVLAYFFPTYAPTRSHRKLLAAILLVTFSLSVVVEALGWRWLPDWWQGRYIVPVLVGMAMLLFSDPDRRERPGLFALAAWMTGLYAYMICMNYWRFDYGISEGFPIQFQHAAFGLVQSLAVYGVATTLVATCFVFAAAERALRAETGGSHPMKLGGAAERVYPSDTGGTSRRDVKAHRT